MFAGMAISMTVSALTDQVNSFLSIPVVIPLALVSSAVGVVVISVRALHSLLGRRR